MKKLIKISIGIIITILIITILVGVAMIFNPIARSNENVRSYLLRMIPIGTAMDEVIRITEENERWSNIVVRKNSGVVLNSVNMFPVNRPFTAQDSHIIGEKSIRVHLGRAFRINDVSAFFAFDKYGKLIEIFIHRSLAL